MHHHLPASLTTYSTSTTKCAIVLWQLHTLHTHTHAHTATCLTATSMHGYSIPPYWIAKNMQTNCPQKGTEEPKPQQFYYNRTIVIAQQVPLDCDTYILYDTVQLPIRSVSSSWSSMQAQHSTNNNLYTQFYPTPNETINSHWKCRAGQFCVSYYQRSAHTSNLRTVRIHEHHCGCVGGGACPSQFQATIATAAIGQTITRHYVALTEWARQLRLAEMMIPHLPRK